MYILISKYVPEGWLEVGRKAKQKRYLLHVSLQNIKVLLSLLDLL